MKELSDVFKAYGDNFTYQVERLFNDQFRLISKRYGLDKLRSKEFEH